MFKKKNKITQNRRQFSVFTNELLSKGILHTHVTVTKEIDWRVLGAYINTFAYGVHLSDNPVSKAIIQIARINADFSKLKMKKKNSLFHSNLVYPYRNYRRIK